MRELAALARPSGSDALEVGMAMVTSTGKLSQFAMENHHVKKGKSTKYIYIYKWPCSIATLVYRGWLIKLGFTCQCM